MRQALQTLLEALFRVLFSYDRRGEEQRHEGSDQEKRVAVVATAAAT
jgi:hypothetical protein